MSKVFWCKFLNSCQVSKSCKLVQDVGCNTVFDCTALGHVFPVMAPWNGHCLAQDQLWGYTNKTGSGDIIKLSRGEICVANFTPIANGASQGNN